MTHTPRDNYSTRIRIIKIGFPVLAAILLVGVFVFTNSNPIRDGVIIPDRKLAELAVGQKITNPHYSGVTKSGDAFSISAESALPNAPKPTQIDLVKPRTTIGFSDGFEMQASSDIGQLNLDKQEASLTGSVLLETSDNYRATAKIVTMNFYTGNASSPGQVKANGPMGKITAGNMILTQNLHKNTFGGKTILSFGNGVKLVYYPQNTAK